MADPRRGPLVRAGDVIRIPEQHYLYGLGTLTLRVTAVGDDLGAEWIRIDGVEIRWDGSDGPNREVQVRAAALRVAGTVRRRR